MRAHSRAAEKEVRRDIGGILIVQQGLYVVYTRREYLLTDAQGSTYAVLDDFGAPVNAHDRMNFDAFGLRRDKNGLRFTYKRLNGAEVCPAVAFRRSATRSAATPANLLDCRVASNDVGGLTNRDALITAVQTDCHYFPAPPVCAISLRGGFRVHVRVLVTNHARPLTAGGKIQRLAGAG